MVTRPARRVGTVTVALLVVLSGLGLGAAAQNPGDRVEERTQCRVDCVTTAVLSRLGLESLRPVVGLLTGLADDLGLDGGVPPEVVEELAGSAADDADEAAGTPEKVVDEAQDWCKDQNRAECTVDELSEIEDEDIERLPGVDEAIGLADRILDGEGDQVVDEAQYRAEEMQNGGNEFYDETYREATDVGGDTYRNLSERGQDTAARVAGRVDDRLADSAGAANRQIDQARSTARRVYAEAFGVTSNVVRYLQPDDGGLPRIGDLWEEQVCEAHIGDDCDLGVAETWSRADQAIECGQASAVDDPTADATDFDCDGLSLKDEFCWGTDPLDADSDGSEFEDGDLWRDGPEAHYWKQRSQADECGAVGDDGDVVRQYRAASRDDDGDGVPNILDRDSDGDHLLDGIEDGRDRDPDTDTDRGPANPYNDRDGEEPTDPAAPDTDGDGLTDDAEICARGGIEDGYGCPGTGWASDPNDRDTDEDGANDRREATYWGDRFDVDLDEDGIRFNLRDPDADCDTVRPDGDPNCTWSRDWTVVAVGERTNASDGAELHREDPTDPGDWDTDGDGMPDGIEFASGGPDPKTADAAVDGDGDALTNYAEYRGFDVAADEDTDQRRRPVDHDEATEGPWPYGLDPADADMDGDGLLDGQEIHATENPYDDPSNPEDRYYEGWPGSTDVTDRDTDGDGMTDHAELTYTPPPPRNPNRAMTRRDELCRYWPNGHQDEDELTNAEECDGWTAAFDGKTRDVSSDPLDADTDDDRLRDHREKSKQLDPRDEDTDGDGLTDYEEVEIYDETDPDKWDTDGDGCGDEDEVHGRCTTTSEVEQVDSATGRRVSSASHCAEADSEGDCEGFHTKVDARGDCEPGTIGYGLLTTSLEAAKGCAPILPKVKRPRCDGLSGTVGKEERMGGGRVVVGAFDAAGDNDLTLLVNNEGADLFAARFESAGQAVEYQYYEEADNGRSRHPGCVRMDLQRQGDGLLDDVSKPITDRDVAPGLDIEYEVAEAGDAFAADATRFFAVTDPGALPQGDEFLGQEIGDLTVTASPGPDDADDRNPTEIAIEVGYEKEGTALDLSVALTSIDRSAAMAVKIPDVESPWALRPLREGARIELNVDQDKAGSGFTVAGDLEFGTWEGEPVDLGLAIDGQEIEIRDLVKIHDVLVTTKGACEHPRDVCVDGRLVDVPASRVQVELVGKGVWLESVPDGEFSLDYGPCGSIDVELPGSGARLKARNAGPLERLTAERLKRLSITPGSDAESTGLSAVFDADLPSGTRNLDFTVRPAADGSDGTGGPEEAEASPCEQTGGGSSSEGDDGGSEIALQAWADDLLRVEKPEGEPGMTIRSTGFADRDGRSAVRFGVDGRIDGDLVHAEGRGLHQVTVRAIPGKYTPDHGIEDVVMEPDVGNLRLWKEFWPGDAGWKVDHLSGADEYELTFQIPWCMDPDKQVTAHDTGVWDPGFTWWCEPFDQDPTLRYEVCPDQRTPSACDPLE